MLCVYGSPLYQWDRNRQLQINSVDIDSKFEVHCAHSDDSYALVVEPKIEGDTLLANIPNILLQRSGYLRVYVVTEGDTIYDQTFYVMARQKPDDYVYTETEVLSYSSLEKRIAELEKGGVSEEQIAEAVGKYLDENPIAEADPNVPDWAKQPEKPTYTADEVGALSQDELQSGVNIALQQAKESGAFNGKDYVLTESDKQDIADMIPIPEVGGGSEWRKIADITLEEDVTMFSISTDMNGNPLDITEVWAYFDVYQYNEELESGKTRDESMWMLINGEKLPFVYSSGKVRCSSQNSPYHQMYYSGYNSKNGQMIMSTTIMSTLGEYLPSIRNTGFTVDEKIHQLGYQMPYPNRKWASGSKIVIYGR